MKSLKFRAWDGKKMIDDVVQASETSIIEFYDIYEWQEIEVKSVEQYTGLKDKNGKDIYEGDIVKVNDDFDKYGLNAGEIYEVYFNAGGFRCKPKYESSITRGDKGFWIDDGNDYEVIGNIHENADLLGDK